MRKPVGSAQYFAAGSRIYFYNGNNPVNRIPAYFWEDVSHISMAKNK